MAGGDTAAVERHVGAIWREAYGLRARLADQHAFDGTPRVFFGPGVSEEIKRRFAPV